jgi:hypothetical protein
MTTTNSSCDKIEGLGLGNIVAEAKDAKHNKKQSVA